MAADGWNTDAVASETLRRLMRNTSHVAEPLDAYLIPMEDAHQSEYISPADCRLEFVSGFTGSRGLGAVTATKAAMWTDGRYFIQANNQMDSNWSLMKEGQKETLTLEAWLAENLRAGGKVGVDTFLISATRFRDLRKKLRVHGVSLIGAGADNLVDMVWTETERRPTRGTDRLMVLPVALTGRAWHDKVAGVRTRMKENNAKLLLLSALDEIAWLFNLRGSDIAFNPVFFAYAAITQDRIRLFIDEAKITPEVSTHLGSVDSMEQNMQNGDSNEKMTALSVEILPYDAILSSVVEQQTNLFETPTDKVWLPESSTSQAVVALVDKDRRLVKPSPVELMKAVKNEVELAGMKNAHLKDAVAHCRFLYWLERELLGGTGGTHAPQSGGQKTAPTELSAALHFEHLRRDQPDYVSLSFETISAVGLHAARPHYAPTAATDTPITTQHVYLTDSGAQYRDGTTDVTRTIHLGEPTDHQKKCFTLVLKGHIALATQRFPERTNGMRLDTLARAALWNQGLDYSHGTGHGVGHFLNVHEGPAGIGYRSLSYAQEGIVKNMVLTIEPGYYEEEGEFGIRIENVCAVVEDASVGAGFLTFDSMTLVPIQTKMLDPTLLTDKEIVWLNDYHTTVLERVGPLLTAQGHADVLRWLQLQCRPIG